MAPVKTVLVVDDDNDLRAGLTAVLRKEGLQTLEADDGTAARDLIDRHHPDLVILDMMMPRWGGLAVLEHFQGRPDAPPFIMITANDGPKHRAYAERLGVVDYLHKPFPPEQLLAAVARSLPAPNSDRDDGTVRCRCGHCGARIKAPARLVGQTRSCPGCRRSLPILPEGPEDEGPRIV